MCVCVHIVCVVCACVCVRSRVWCVCVFFLNIYLQHVPLHGKTTCSSVHVIHYLFFWSVIGTTSRDL